jgi:hypothetical protein
VSETRLVIPAEAESLDPAVDVSLDPGGATTTVSAQVVARQV